jgi:hypothetical protein
MSLAKFFCSVFFVLTLTFSTLALAHMENVTPANFDTQYQALLKDYASIRAELPKGFTKKTKHHSFEPVRLSPDKAKLKKRFDDMDALIDRYKPVYDLKTQLVQMFMEHQKAGFSLTSLNQEAVMISLGVIDEIHRLKSKYKSFLMPIVHNMMIDVGIKKRGACKHWAEDLLLYLRELKREHFYVTWGEANPRKMTEHNVAVVYPRHDTFYDGLLIDPWRTAGRPFWIRVKADHHYKWNKWDGYAIY